MIKPPMKSSEDRKSKYLEFRFIRQKPKTKVYHIIAKKTGNSLGQIQWYNGWRKYAFMPVGFTMFDSQCLKDIYEFIKNLDIEHKKQRR